MIGRSNLFISTVFGLAVGLALPASGAVTRAYDATISPVSVAAGSSSTLFTVVIENDPGTSHNQDIRSASVAIPGGFTVGSSLAVSASHGKSWSATLSGATIILGATTGNQGLAAGESLTLTFHVVAPCVNNTYTWTTAAYQDSLNTQGSLDTATPYTLVGSQPTVTVTGQCQQQLLSGYCTIGQGGWGSSPQGNNPGELLSTYFGAVYTGGFVQVGAANWMKFDSAAKIDGYLPAGSTPSTLSTTYTDPTSTSAGVFGGQVLALRLNDDFQALIPGAVHSITSLVLTGTGTSLDGSTVAAIEAAAEKALGGGALPAGFTISGLNDLVDALNNAFENCTTSAWAEAHLVPGV